MSSIKFSRLSAQRLKAGGIGLTTVCSQLKLKSADTNETVTHCHGLKVKVLDGNLRMRDSSTLAFLPSWEEICKSAFNFLEFEGVKKDVSLKRRINHSSFKGIEFDPFEVQALMKVERSGEHLFYVSPLQ